MRRFTPYSSRHLSFEDLGDYADGVAAGLEARSELAALAAPWHALTAKCDDADQRQRRARRGLNRARVIFTVEDGEHDHKVLRLSTETYHWAGKDALAEPYVSFFDTMTAASITRLGEAKATAWARRAIARKEHVLASLTAEETKRTLGAILTDLENASSALTAAADRREEARNALSTYDIERRQLVRTTLELIADTEIGILTQFKGRRDLVDRVLALDFDAPASKDDRASTPSPDDPQEPGTPPGPPEV